MLHWRYTGCYNGGIMCYTGGILGAIMVVLCVTLVVLIGKQMVVGGIRWY